MTGRVGSSVLILLIAGCAVQSPYNRSYVSQGIRERTDYELGQVSEPGESNLPEGISFEDGLSADEAVAIALWNNAQFQADLTALGFSRADLIEANMLANPVFSILFPLGPKVLETTLSLPVDILWQRPHRIAAAELDAERLSENLIEHGLALIRDVQSAYADLWLAQERMLLFEADAQLQAQVAEFQRARARAGDISELATTASQVDSLRATDLIKRSSVEIEVLRQRLRGLLGLISEDAEFEITQPDAPSKSTASLDELLHTAFVARPDLRAAELMIEAAGQRVGWEKSKVYNLIAIIDAEDKGADSLSAGPGLAVEIPIFNQNDGKVARAEAELEQATRQYEAVRQNIILQVSQAHARHVSAQEEFHLWNSEIVPTLTEAAKRAKRSFEIGETTYLAVLEARLKLIDAQMRLTELSARLHHSAAELNCVIGKRVI